MGSQPPWKAVIESSGANFHAMPTSRFPRPLQVSPPSCALSRSDPAFTEPAKDSSRKPSSISLAQGMLSSSELLSAERMRTCVGCVGCTGPTNPVPPSPGILCEGSHPWPWNPLMPRGEHSTMLCARMGRGRVSLAIHGWHLQMRPRSHHETRHLGMATLISLPEHSF